MPRDLADVLHYFLPELDADSQPEARTLAPFAPSRVHASDSSTSRPLAADAPAFPLLGVPIGDSDVVKAALLWNLAVETARLGGRAIVLAPASGAHTPLWPEAGVGPLGTETILCQARDLQELTQTAADLAISHAASAHRGGAIFVGVPTRWLATNGAQADPIVWWLLMSSSNRNDLAESFDLAKAVRYLNSKAEVGVTIHGVTSVNEARCAFKHLSRLCQTRLQLDLTSYGLLVDDLYVYRAIAAQRPIGLAHPQAPATRALMDVAGLLYEDARSRVLG